ncbi:MAG: hypothetical protein J0L73_19205 [Verrucomicrobia bacterium]|nr:hypothetical protein [Verrucomicrobiota bacterium]
MKPPSDDDLIEVFSHARRCDREEAPAWRPELLEGPRRRPQFALCWALAGLVAASVIVLPVFFTDAPRKEPTLSEVLPPLLDSPPGELFASQESSLLTFEAPSDFLLTEPLNLDFP